MLFCSQMLWAEKKPSFFFFPQTKIIVSGFTQNLGLVLDRNINTRRVWQPICHGAFLACCLKQQWVRKQCAWGRKDLVVINQVSACLFGLSHQ